MSTWLVQTLAVAAGLAILAALAGCWRRIGPRTRHALWLLVLLKLMMPPLVVVTWPEATPAEASLALEPTPPATPAPEPVAEPGPLPPPEPIAPPAVVAALPAPAPEPIPLTLPPEPVQSRLEPIAPPLEPEPIAEPASIPAAAQWLPSPAAGPFRWLDWLVPASLAAWLVGSIAVAARQAYRLLRFRRQLAREARENIFADLPQWILDEFADAARGLGVKPPRVVRTALVDTPLVWCLGRPLLLLPDALIEDLSRDAWRGILRHELAHLRRRDHWVARLELLGEVAWWWNPLFWLARVQIHKYAELCCDAWVIALGSDTPGRHAYASALLSVCEHLSKPRPTPTLGLALGMGVGESELPGSRSARTLERRLRMILEEPPAGRSSRLALLLVLALGLVAVPIWLHERDRALIRELAVLTASLRPSSPAVPEATPVLPPATTPGLVPFEEARPPEPVAIPAAMVTNAVLPVPGSFAIPPMDNPPAALPLPDTTPPLASSEDGAARARAALEKPTTIVLRQQPLRQMLSTLGKETGLMFALAPRFKDDYESLVQFPGFGNSLNVSLAHVLKPLGLVAVLDDSGIVMITGDTGPQTPRVATSTTPVPANTDDDRTDYTRRGDAIRNKVIPRSVVFENQPLGDVLHELSKSIHDVRLYSAVKGEIATRVTFRSSGGKLRDELAAMLSPLGLSYVVGSEGTIWVTDKDRRFVHMPSGPAAYPPGTPLNQRLSDRIDMIMVDQPFTDAIGWLRVETGLNFIVDRRTVATAIKNASVEAMNVKLSTALKLLLQPLNLTYKVEDDRVIITTPPEAQLAARRPPVPTPAAPPPALPEATNVSASIPPPAVAPPAVSAPLPEIPPPGELARPAPPAAPPVPAEPDPSFSPSVLPAPRPPAPAEDPAPAPTPSPAKPAAPPEVQRSPFELDSQAPPPTTARAKPASPPVARPLRPSPSAPVRRDDLPPATRARDPFDRGEAAIPRSETESREVLVIQIRKANAVLARATAQKEFATAILAKCIRLVQKDKNLVSAEEMNKAEAEMKFALASVELSEGDVAEAEARLKEFDRRRARDLAKLKLSLNYAKKALEITQAQRNQGMISYAEVRKSEQAVEELELQLRYDFPEVVPSPKAAPRHSDEPELEPVPQPK